MHFQCQKSTNAKSWHAPYYCQCTETVDKKLNDDTSNCENKEITTLNFAVWIPNIPLGKFCIHTGKTSNPWLSIGHGNSTLQSIENQRGVVTVA